MTTSSGRSTTLSTCRSDILCIVPWQHQSLPKSCKIDEGSPQMTGVLSLALALALALTLAVTLKTTEQLDPRE